MIIGNRTSIAVMVLVIALASALFLAGCASLRSKTPEREWRITDESVEPHESAPATPAGGNGENPRENSSADTVTVKKGPTSSIDRPVAVFTFVRTEVIGYHWFSEQVRILESQLGKPTSVAERKNFLLGIIGDRILVQAARKEGFGIKEGEVELALNQFKLPYERDLGRKISLDELREIVERERETTGIGWDALIEKVRTKIVTDKYIRTREIEAERAAVMPPSDAKIRDYYEENQSRFVSPEMVRFKHIFVLTKGLDEGKLAAYRARTEEVCADLKRGVPFDRYREVYLGGNREQIGDLEVSVWRRDNEDKKFTYGRDFFSTLFAMPTGRVSDVLESALGLHIIEVIGKYPFRVLGLDDTIPPDDVMTVREYIAGTLSQMNSRMKATDERNTIVDELMKQSSVRIYEENLKGAS